MDLNARKVPGAFKKRAPVPSSRKGTDRVGNETDRNKVDIDSRELEILEGKLEILASSRFPCVVS